MKRTEMKRKVVVAMAAAMLSGMGAAEAVTVGFSDFLSPTYWEMQPELGSVNFVNGNTELVIQGPTDLGTAYETSADGAVYQGPGGLGLPVGQSGMLSFNWSFNSGDALSAQADFSWTTPGGSQNYIFGTAGPGSMQQGTLNVWIHEESMFSFLLTTLSPLGDKAPAELVINNVEFQNAQTPDAGSTLGLLGCGLAFLVLYERYSRKRAGENCLATAVK